MSIPSANGPSVSYSFGRPSGAQAGKTTQGLSVAAGPQLRFTSDAVAVEPVRIASATTPWPTPETSPEQVQNAFTVVEEGARSLVAQGGVHPTRVVVDVAAVLFHRGVTPRVGHSADSRPIRTLVGSREMPIRDCL